MIPHKLSHFLQTFKTISSTFLMPVVATVLETVIDNDDDDEAFLYHRIK